MKFLLLGGFVAEVAGRCPGSDSEDQKHIAINGRTACVRIHGCSRDFKKKF